MLEHTLSTYCNSQTAEQETWKETEQEKIEGVFDCICTLLSSHTVSSGGLWKDYSTESIYQKFADGIFFIFRLKTY